VQTRWDRIKVVERMQAHIEAHLGEPITMAALARAAGYSPWYAARLFKEFTGKTPFEYVRLRRLSTAAERLRDTPSKVVDVAFDFVFDSHEGFTRAFARSFGVSPSRFRHGCPAELFYPPQLRDWYARRQRGELDVAKKLETPPTTVFVQVMDRPARRAIVKRGKKATHYFEYCEEVGCEVWTQLGTIEGALGEPMGLWLPERFRAPGTSAYVQGVEVPADYAGPVPEGLDLIDLPACQQMVFQGPPFEDQDFEAAIASLWDAMNAYRPETYGFAWADDDGPRFQLRPEGYRGYIEGRPVRRV
jgi:AraC-like DNA-binding protein